MRVPEAQGGTLPHTGSIQSCKLKITDESAGIGDIKRHAPILTGVGAVTGRDRREQAEGVRCIFRLCLRKVFARATLFWRNYNVRLRQQIPNKSDPDFLLDVPG